MQQWSWKTRDPESDERPLAQQRGGRRIDAREEGTGLLSSKPLVGESSPRCGLKITLECYRFLFVGKRNIRHQTPRLELGGV